jgi:protocatechuate 3,4-dioxygenase beta subunit
MSESRRAFIHIGFLGLSGLMLGCTRRKSSLEGLDGSGGTSSPKETGSSSTETGSPDTAAPGDTSAPTDTAGADTGDGPRICSETPDNIEGPFWVRGVPVRSDLDLYGDTGPEMTISGQVTDLACTPIPGAIVEIWQANPDGEYDNDSAEKRYRGQLAADADGRYSFHTLKPGWYLNGPRYRPSHIHIKIWVEGRELKTTQLYFEGDPYIEGDAFVVDGLILPLSGDETSGFTGRFDFAVG